MFINRNTDDKVLQSYRSLSDYLRTFADVAILIYEPISYYEYEPLYVSFAGKTLKAKFNEAYLSLRKAGIFDEYNYSYLTVPESLLIALYPELVQNKKYEKFVKTVHEKLPLRRESLYYIKETPYRCMRNFLYGHYFGDNQILKLASEKLLQNTQSLKSVWVRMVFQGNCLPVLLKMPAQVIVNVVFESFINVLFYFEESKQLEALILAVIDDKKFIHGTSDSIELFHSIIQVFKGNLNLSSKLSAKKDSINNGWLLSTCLLYQGKPDEAKSLFYEHLLAARKLHANKKLYPDVYQGFYYVFGLSVHNPEKNLKELQEIVKLFEKSQFIEHKIYEAVANIGLGKKYEAKKILAQYDSLQFISLSPLIVLYYLMTVYLMEGKLDGSQQKRATQLLSLSKANGFLLLALELEFMLANDPQKFKPTVLPGVTPILAQIDRKEEWEQALAGLLSIGRGKNITSGPNKQENINRVAYCVDFDRSIIQPILQTRSASGWSKGRNIALKRLKDQQVEGLTDQDIRIAAAIKQANSYYKNDYYIDFSKAISELVGHPLLFLNSNPDISVELVKSQPELITEKTAKGFELRCDVSETENKTLLIKETNTRYRFIELTDEQRSVIRALNAQRVIIPTKGKEKLADVISHVSGFMTVHSDLVSTDEKIRAVDADPRIRVQLLPMGDALKVEWFVKPFGQVPPYCKPGKGGKTVYGVLENEKCLVNRNLSNELDNVQALSNALNDVADADFVEGPVTFSDPYECLSLLEILRTSQDFAVVEWPEGERFRVKRTASFKQLQLKVNSRGNWFEMTGELKVDEDTVLSIQQLLAMRTKSRGRFIEIGEGEFIALSAELKKRLDELAMYSSVEKTGLKVNKFAAHTLDDIGQAAGSFKTDKAWVAFRKKMKETNDLVIDVPSTLDAELRPYQEEGFRWMARLAAWDAGACLADDMGLGKTLQALALLLHRAPQGPALVVCPASVANNWASETQRFAPSLTVKLLRQGNRDEVLDNPSAFDIVIITYGILQSEEDRIAKISWQTVVLDEAHAIKNANTKTSKAAMGIQAGFRLILTGTPIQNHLGELWNLFNFINPGLLGSLQQFNARFASNDGIDGGAADKQYLKKLIAPFLLRRTKSKVLDELPPKTEITHKVELSEAEMSFYEALRRQAISNIETDDSHTGQKHLKALAEITRLRLACCNPSLVDDKMELPSAKLDAFFEILDELIDNKHRALVFSQFIGHLSIVRKALEKRKITYQYLDGSTPVPDRAGIVKDFQTGKGDVFLISLKAGGLGLNLTAADYVIHLDPWWNPAIEDQASDRAHRIGQTRPVTIYRLVAKDTIEEKIIQLHNTKRDIADSLLEGTDQAAKLSTTDILNLLKEL